MTSKRSLTVALSASTLVAAALAGTPAASGTVAAKAIPNTAPAWISHAKSLGRAGTADAISFRVYLSPKGGLTGLKAAATAVATPGSASYRSFLSADGYHAAYDASPDTVSAVRSWLAGHGLRVTQTESHNRYLQVAGTVAQTQSALGVTIGTYRHDGKTVRSNDSAVKVPASIAPDVLTVTGLDTTPSPMKPGSASVAPKPAAKPVASKPGVAIPQPPAFVNGRPCSTYYGQLLATKKADYKTRLPLFGGKTLPYAVCGYTGPQFRAAYTGNAAAKGQDGSGVTVAVIDAYASPSIASDANTYATRHGDGSYVAGQLTQVLPSTFTDTAVCDASGWFGEETLDVEAVHAMAPGANIRYYGAASCYDSDFLTTQTAVVDENKASIITNSYGEADYYLTADAIAAEEEVFLQAALQGISFMFSSGDNGDELANTALLQTDASGSDPYVTAVGGTADAIGGDGTFQFQTGWGTEKYLVSPTGKAWKPTGFIYGAGGGYSSLFNRPAYQQGVVPADAPPGRAVPDVAMDADPTTGMLIGETQTFPEGVHYGEYRIGGTSLASPLLAGQTALLLQHAGGRLGFLNPLLYSQAGTKVFNDIKGAAPDAGNVRVDYINALDATAGVRHTVRTLNQDSSLQVQPGWDDVTGVGSPGAAWIKSVSP